MSHPLPLPPLPLPDRLCRPIAWLALAWLLAIGLSRLGSAAPLAAEDLSAGPWLGMALLAIGLGLPPRQQALLRIIGIACMVMALLLLLRWASTFSGGDLMANTSVDGASVLGRYALGGWLLGAGLVCWGLGTGSTPGLALALGGAAAMSMATAAAAVFALSCQLIFGELPGAKVLISPAALVLVALLSLAAVLSGWARVAQHRLDHPDESYRWTFARSLAVLLSTCTAAGLGAAALTSLHSVDLLSEGLLSRTQRQAQALEQQLQRSADLVSSLRQADLLQALSPLGDAAEVREAAPPEWAEAWPVLEHPGLKAALLADGSTVLSFDKGPARFVRLHARYRTDALDRTSPAEMQQALLCNARTQARDGTEMLECAALLPPPQIKAERLTLRVITQRHGALLETWTPESGRELAAQATVGTLGTQLVLRLSPASLFRIVGGPMLQAMLLLLGLSLLGSVWSYRRQLPHLRQLHLLRAQGEATLRKLPLAVLVLDRALRVIEANPAAEALLGLHAHTLVGQALEPLLPGWQGPPAGGGDAGASLRLEARDAAGAFVPVEVRSTHFTLHGQQRHLLMLRDLREELRDAQTLQRWQHVFEHAGCGMAIASAGVEPRLELVNGAYARLLGYTPEELRGQPVRHGLAPEFWEQLQALRAQAAGGHVVQAALRHRHRDGHQIPTLLNLIGVLGPDGTLQHYVASVQDISALRQAEDQASRRALQLGAVLEALPLGVWLGDPQGHVQQTNAAARALWPQSGDEQAAQLEHESMLRRAAITRRQVVREQVPALLPDGSERHLLITARPLLDAASGALLGAIAIDEDMAPARRGAQALRQALDLLERVLQSCAVGIALVDEQGQLLRHNPAWTLLLGELTRQDLLAQLLEPTDPLRQRELIGRVGRGDIPSYVGEHRLRRVTGRYGWTLLLVSRLPGTPQDAARVLIQVMDIDERRRAGEEIITRQFHLAAAQRLARVGDWQWDVTSGLFSCSEQMLLMLGQGQAPLGRISHAKLMLAIEPDDRKRLSAALDRALSEIGRVDLDIRLMRNDGQPLIAHLQGVAQRAVDGLMMSGTLQDVTERKRIESELRESRERLRELVAYEDQLIEEERKRIAREVHDELGQLLTALRMDLSMLRGELPPDSSASGHAERMRDTMSNMAEVVRHVASHLRPAALDLGLVPAIEWLAEDFSLRWETQVTLQLPREHEPQLPEPVALALFRTVQESLTNIAKHAHAGHVQITLTDDRQGLHLRVSDDGQGFDPVEVAARRNGGLGLLGMRERMHAIGATLAVHSSASGTQIDIHYRGEPALSNENRQP